MKDTVKDADRMEAGRELDALVAVEVMGWKQSVRRGLHRNAHVWEDDSSHIARGLGDFAPSTLIADAWAAVEAMAAKGWAMALDMEVYEGKPVYGVAFWNGREFNGDADADTAPLAICASALEALATRDASVSVGDSRSASVEPSPVPEEA